MNNLSIRDRPGLFSFLMVAILFCLMLICGYLAFTLLRFTLPSFFGIADPMLFMSDLNHMISSPQAALYAQAISSSIGIFIIPAVLFHFIFRYDMAETLHLLPMPSSRTWLTAIGTMIAGAIFIQLLVQITASIPLPSSLGWMRGSQDQQTKLLEAFFTDQSFSHFLLLAFVLALLPGIGEELCFRGTIQNLLAKTDLGSMGAVILTGFLFSMVHMQFDNFFAIWCMGIILGLLYYYTDSIVVSIVAHFINNLLAVGGKYAYIKGLLPADVMSMDSMPIYITLPAGAMMIYGLILMRRWSGKNSVLRS